MSVNRIVTNGPLTRAVLQRLALVGCSQRCLDERGSITRRVSRVNPMFTVCRMVEVLGPKGQHKIVIDVGRDGLANRFQLPQGWQKLAEHNGTLSSISKRSLGQSSFSMLMEVSA